VGWKELSKTGLKTLLKSARGALTKLQAEIAKIHLEMDAEFKMRVKAKFPVFAIPPPELPDETPMLLEDNVESETDEDAENQ